MHQSILPVRLIRFSLIFLIAAVVYQEVMPNGLDNSTSGRIESFLVPRAKLTTSVLSIQDLI